MVTRCNIAHSKSRTNDDLPYLSHLEGEVIQLARAYRPLTADKVPRVQTTAGTTRATEGERDAVDVFDVAFRSFVLGVMVLRWESATAANDQ